MASPVDKDVCDERHKHDDKFREGVTAGLKAIKETLTDLTIQFKSRGDPATAIRKALPWIITLVSLLGSGGVAMNSLSPSAPAQHASDSQQP